MKNYKEVNGTYYDARTSDKVINVLENCRKNNTRIIIDYGDITTGESWNEIYDITGRIGRSTGNVKIPILLYNSRSINGCAIIDHCIIRVKESNGGKVLYSYN
tara:strand:- start:687 stop:995 length:309 start_codon:yes stop_codon:yes gene_type:complete